MLSKKQLYKTQEYWVEEIQNEIYKQVRDYMHKHNMNQNELAEHWKVSKGYISQILKGNCNFSLKKLVELSLAMQKAPLIQYVNTDVIYEIDRISSYMNSMMRKNMELEISKGECMIPLISKSNKLNVDDLNRNYKNKEDFNPIAA